MVPGDELLRPMLKSAACIAFDVEFAGLGECSNDRQRRCSGTVKL